ncbi:MAG: hypothetical protein NC818_05075 [Candidatus Omnitrophica bacterium]|nr:hypothetical protein [Candidatus Omnitrophota bacterium]
MATLPFFILLGPSLKTALLSNLLYLFILIYALYKIGGILDNEYTGMGTALLVSFYPGIFGFSRVYMLDFSITALVALFFYFLLESEYFQKKIYSFFSSLTIIIGLLHKQTFLIYFFIPFLIYSSHAIYKFGKIKIISILFFVLPLLIVLPWYLQHMPGQLYLLNAANTSFTINRLNNIYKFSCLNLWKYQLYPLLTILLFFCLFLYSITKSKHKIFILSWLCTPLFYFLFFTYEDFPRHTLPSLPASGIVIAYVLNNLPQYIKIYKGKILNLYKHKIFLCLFLFCLVQFFIINYKKDKYIFTSIDFDKRTHREGMLYAVSFDYEDIDNIIDLVIKDMKLNNEKMIFIIGLATDDLFEDILRFKIIQRWRIPYVFETTLEKISHKIKDKMLTPRVLLFLFNLEKDCHGSPKIIFQPYNFDYILITEPIEKYSDAFYSLRELRNPLFRHKLYTFLHEVIEKNYNIKISYSEAEKLFFELFLEIQNNQYNYQLLKKIELPKSIFKNPYPKIYYLYKRINL